MDNSIVFISRPTVIVNDLPQAKPADFLSTFHYEISRPVQAPQVSLIIGLYFSIYPETTKQETYDFATHSLCEIETRHSFTENYMLLHKAIKVIIDNHRNMFEEMQLTGYTNDVKALLPYPKYEILLPILKEIFNPAEGIMVN